MPGITDAQVDVVADEAIAWVKSVSKNTKKALTKDKAKALAKAEYDSVEALTRIVVADKARAMLRGVNRAIRSGKIGKEWGGGTIDDALLETIKGPSPRSLFLTTLQSAFNAGEWQRMQKDESIVYLLYHTMLDERVRYSHRPLEAVCLPKTHVWWEVHMPPNGPNCRCTVQGLSQAEFDALKGDSSVRLQLEPPEEPEVTYTNKFTGETSTLPASVAPGYDFNPGTKAGGERFQQMLERRIRSLMDAPEEAL